MQVSTCTRKHLYDKEIQYKISELTYNSGLVVEYFGDFHDNYDISDYALDTTIFYDTASAIEVGALKITASKVSNSTGILHTSPEILAAITISGDMRCLK